MKRNSIHKKTVAVAMSGGVDSSVAAALLIEQGYNVFGITMQISQEDWPSKDTNKWATTVEDAKRVAEHLGIPHFVIDLSQQFETCIVNNLVNEYACGRTPNPCVRCNKYIKFGILLRNALAMGADAIATGHYARIQFNQDRGRWSILRGTDKSKDQSYVLCGINQYQIQHTILPIGNFTKEEIINIANEIGLDSIANKPESQDICFISDNNYTSFINRRSGKSITAGPILDTEGNVIGRHQGLAFYTIGQRKRIGVTSPKPLYVINIDSANNAIIVGEKEDLYSSTVYASDFNWISIDNCKEPIAVTAKIRYNMIESPALLQSIDETHVMLTFEEPQRAITPGQSLVCYVGDELVGGGIINTAKR